MDRFEERAHERLTELGDVDTQSFAASFVLFRLATRYLSLLESSIHRPQGLSAAGFRVLFTVWVYGELEPRQIAKLSGVSTAAVSGVLTTLESKKLIQKKKDTADRRLVRVNLTEQGERLLVETYRQQNVLESRLFGELHDVEDLTSRLRTLLAEVRPDTASGA